MKIKKEEGGDCDQIRPDFFFDLVIQFLNNQQPNVLFRDYIFDMYLEGTLVYFVRTVYIFCYFVYCIICTM